MTIHECERKAQIEGFDRCLFTAGFPAGPRLCRWLDAYLGGYLVEGLSGVVNTGLTEQMFPGLECTDFLALTAEEADKRFPIANHPANPFELDSGDEDAVRLEDDETKTTKD